MTRREFIEAAGSAAVTVAANSSIANTDGDKSVYATMQGEIDKVTPADFKKYLEGGTASHEAFLRLDGAFEKVLGEVRETTVGDVPAVWLVYNMGVIVKTRQTCFSIDLMHRRAKEIAPILDFAMISHNHGDHYTGAFYGTMNGAGKTVISNFMDNYGVKDRRNGGYTRAEKTFSIKDVSVRTTLTDHNGYLIDFTTAFEIGVGNYTIYHSGDCCNVAKLNPSKRPDLWIVHPYCGMKASDGVRKFNPKCTVIAHLNELGHARDRWRWTYDDGFRALGEVKSAGGEGVVPVWGSRLV